MSVCLVTVILSCISFSLFLCIRCAVCCVAQRRVWAQLLSGSGRGVKVCVAAVARRVSLCICVTGLWPC